MRAGLWLRSVPFVGLALMLGIAPAAGLPEPATILSFAAGLGPIG